MRLIITTLLTLASFQVQAMPDKGGNPGAAQGLGAQRQNGVNNGNSNMGASGGHGGNALFGPAGNGGNGGDSASGPGGNGGNGGNSMLGPGGNGGNAGCGMGPGHPGNAGWGYGGAGRGNGGKQCQ